MSKDGCSAEVVVGREEGFGEREGITRGAMVIRLVSSSTGWCKAVVVSTSMASCAAAGRPDGPKWTA